MLKNTSRRTCHGLFWVSAGLWLTLEAWSILDATFHLPLLQTLVNAFALPVSVLTVLHWLHTTTWPFLTLVAAIALRDEAHRWFTGHGTCRIADRLMTSWFVFTATLFLVDWLTPAITVVWPDSAISATIWLLITRIVSVVSRTLHAVSRRRLKKMLHRWPIVKILSTIAELLVPRLRKLKGEAVHVPSPHAHSHRRAR